MRRLATTLSALAFGWACVATVRALVVPAYHNLATSSSTGLGAAAPVASTRTLTEVNGPWVAGLLCAVTLLSGVPLLAAIRAPWTQQGATWATALLVLAFSLVAGFSVGLAFLPSAVILLVSAVATVFMKAPEATPRFGSRGAI